MLVQVTIAVLSVLGLATAWIIPRLPDPLRAWLTDVPVQRAGEADELALLLSPTHDPRGLS